MTNEEEKQLAKLFVEFIKSQPYNLNKLEERLKMPATKLSKCIVGYRGLSHDNSLEFYVYVQKLKRQVDACYDKANEIMKIQYLPR